jgi:hypothetical protein
MNSFAVARDTGFSIACNTIDTSASLCVVVVTKWVNRHAYKRLEGVPLCAFDTVGLKIIRDTTGLLTKLDACPINNYISRITSEAISSYVVAGFALSIDRITTSLALVKLRLACSAVVIDIFDVAVWICLIQTPQTPYLK